jgi:hypothetical protein
MTLANTFLEKLAEWRPTERASVSAADASGSVYLTADRADLLGCLVWELAVRRAAPPAGGLAAWAERLADRITGLVEPLTVHEVDALRGEALLRSAGPSPRGDRLLYYEILLRGSGEALLRRYQASHDLGTRREQITFALTHEALAKLVNDLVCAE